MPLPVIADVWRVVYKWTDGSAHAVSVTHVHDTTSALNAAGVFAILDANVDGAMWYSVSSAASIVTVSLTKLDGVSAAVDFPTGSPAKWTGSIGGQSIPQLAALVKATTGFRGPKNRGRMFIPFTSEAAQADGVIDAGQLAAGQTAWDDWRDDLNAANLVPVVASYKHSTAEGISKYLCEAESGTQRRRQQRNRR
jgi:hypothetical protein